MDGWMDGWIDERKKDCIDRSREKPHMCMCVCMYVCVYKKQKRENGYVQNVNGRRFLFTSSSMHWY